MGYSGLSVSSSPTIFASDYISRSMRGCVIWQIPQVIDITMLSTELARHGELDSIGDEAYLGRLIDGVPDPPRAELYVKEIHEAAERRRLTIRQQNSARPQRPKRANRISRTRLKCRWISPLWGWRTRWEMLMWMIPDCNIACPCLLRRFRKRLIEISSQGCSDEVPKRTDIPVTMNYGDAVGDELREATAKVTARPIPQ